jgi:hypothetical protein
MFIIKETSGELACIIVTHSCGHQQVCTPTKKKLALGESKWPGFIDRQYSWLADNLCPGCYTLAKEQDPNFKPVGG